MINLDKKAVATKMDRFEAAQESSIKHLSSIGKNLRLGIFSLTLFIVPTRGKMG